MKKTVFSAVLGLLPLLAAGVTSAQSTLLSSRTFNGAGNSDDVFFAAAAAPGGGYFLAGYSSSAATGADIWLVKVDAALNLVASTTLNGSGSGYDSAYGLAVNGAGQLYAVGAASVAAFGMQPWLGKFTSGLTLISSTTYVGGVAIPGDNNASFDAVVVEPSGDVLAAGDGYPAPGAPWSTILLMRYSPALTVLATATYSNGFASEYGAALVRAPSGDLFVGGGIAPAALTSHDAWLGKFNSSLVLQTSVTLAGAAGHSDSARGLAFGTNGDLYVAGAMIDSGVTADIWLARYTTDLLRVSSRSVAGVADTSEQGSAMAAGPAGTMVLGGSLSQTGQLQNLLLGEIHENDLTFKTTTTATSAGSSTDIGYAVVVDTMSGAAILAGFIAGDGLEGWIGRYNVSAPALASIAVAPPSASGLAGATTQLSAVATFSGGSTASAAGYDWSTSASTVATVNGSGLVTFVALGTAAITVTSGPVTGQALVFTTSCSTITSAQSGNWSSTATWASGVVPTACGAVVVAGGHIVTLDTTTAAASTTAIYGRLRFSRTASSRLTLVAGDINVEPGGWLDLGVEGDSIPTPQTAALVLAQGASFSSYYKLTVKDGGRFSAHGATKSPYAYLTASAAAGASVLSVASTDAAGWAIGDLLEVGPSTGSGTASVWRATVTAVAGGSISFAPSLDIARDPTSARPVLVANLTRNVLVRSSGTITETTTRDTAEIRNLTTSTNGFVTRHAEFAHLGGWGFSPGIRFMGAGVLGSISSCTFHDSYRGVQFDGADGQTIENTVFARLKQYGVEFTNDADRHLLRRNVCLGSGGECVYVGSGRGNRVEDGYYCGNGGPIAVIGPDTTVSNNQVCANGGVAVNMAIGSAGSLITGNRLFSNDFVATEVQTATITLVGNTYFDNAAAMRVRVDGRAVVSGGAFGYEPGGASAPDASEVSFVFSGGKSARLYGVRVNPAVPVETTWLASPDAFVLSYDHDQATGTLRLWGHHIVQAGTLALDDSQRLYLSTATTPRLMRGAGHVLSVCSTDDASAVSELVTVERTGGAWRARGSVSGDLGVLTATTCGAPTDFGRFALALAAGAPQEGDALQFASLAASPVASVRKRLLFQGGASGYRSGRATLAVAPGAGLSLLGGAARTVELDLAAASTFYHLSSSGALTAVNADLRNISASGLQLSGSGGVSLSTVTFDLPEVVSGATVSHITADALSSGATLQSVTFQTTRSTAAAAAAYNVRVLGADGGLSWLFQGGSSPLWGENHDYDPNNRVLWDGGTLPAPNAFAGAALSPTAILWSWADNASNEDGCRVMSGAANLSGDLAADAVSWTQTGLSPDTSYGPYFARAFHGTGTADSATASRRTLAAPPTGTAVSSFTAIVATITWALNGNPASTLAEVHRSTDNATFSLYYSSAVLLMRDASLLGCTSYYYKVRDLNGDAVATAFDATVLMRTADTIPAAPVSLSAEAVAGGRVALAWTGSPTEGVTGYRLFSDGGAGAFNFGAPLAVFTSTETSFTTGVLTSSAAYAFALRATHRCGTVDTSGVFASAASTATLASVRAAIKNPDSGKRVHGNRVTVMAELTSGTPSDVSQVLFQYRASTSAPWIDIVAANVNHPNADLQAPYFVHWNVNALAGGFYHLRAVARDTSGNDDPAPGSIIIRIVGPADDYDIEESEVAGEIQKNQKLDTAVVNTVASGGKDADDALAKIVLPPGAVNTTTVTVTVEANPTLTTAPPSGFTSVGSSLRIDLSNGQHDLSNGQTACITMSYPSSAGDPARLSIYSYDDAAGQWKKDFASTVNASSRTITGCTPHFSIFAVFAGVATATMLDAIRVYPNPYRPNGGNPNEGKAFSTGDVTSGIIFDNLPAAVTIDIFSLAGRRVARFDTTASGGLIRWNARNSDGRDAASGGYFAVISSPGLKSTVKKLLIIR